MKPNLPDIVPGALSVTVHALPWTVILKRTSTSIGKMTSGSSTVFSVFATDVDMGTSSKAICAELTLMMDSSMLSSRERLFESPVRECRNKRRVQARTRDSTNDENEFFTFSDIALDAYTNEDLVQDVADPRVWTAFCSEATCAALAEVSAALWRTDASIFGKCSPTPGNGFASGS